MAVNVENKGTVHDTVKFLGSGRVIIEAGAQIRHYSIIEMNNGILHLGKNSILGFFSMVQCTGEISIGIDTMIGPHNTLLASYHKENYNPQLQKALVRSKLIIGNNVWSGSHVVFNHGIIVGHNSIIGANSFVNHDVIENTIVAGSPARYIRDKV